ncbi:c-type cytochrome [Roseomonas chloroacetimidivorans]|uniref:c-type cytochrome n=1 Tax=Roseomonas chloroacetimidivorans TaxID=1766656 RepID=UPI003C7079A6
MVIAAALLLWRDRAVSDPAAIDPGDPVQVALGHRIYGEQCAQCHGGNLEGQPAWQSRRADGRLPAPPHDASGHTWHHPDAVLLRITRDGTSAVVGGGYESDMPGFGGVLTDIEIRAVLAFIKSTWPDRERALQERQSRSWKENSG